MSRKEHRSTGKAILLIISVLMFLSGLIMLLYPTMNGIWINYMMHRDAEVFLSFIYTGGDPSGEETEPAILQTQETAGQKETVPAAYPELWQDMQEYNASIYREGQAGLSNESAYEAPSFILADYGLESEVFAVLAIPALELELPLYLGAARQHMADGAAHLSQTSLPIGGSNTNCVIAGHRGWNGASFFLNITELKPGDEVIITNLWETLTYKVVDTAIIEPNEVEAIHIQPNRELVTLLTCHPPASGGRLRYLVFCERITE